MCSCWFVLHLTFEIILLWVIKLQISIMFVNCLNILFIQVKLNLSLQTEGRTNIGTSKTNPQSSSGLLFVASSSGSIRPMESTPNKVSQRRARACAERCISRLNFTWSQAKLSLVHLSLWRRFALDHINECQLFQCFTIRNFTFGLGSMECKMLCRSRLYALADLPFFIFFYQYQL